MSAATASNKELINRLNRAQGQIEAIKRLLEKGETQDCLKTIQLLKASSNALKKFGEAFVEQHLQECLHRGVPRKELEENLKEVVSSAFNF